MRVRPFAWVALLAAVRGVSGPDLRHDLGKLLFAFIVVWTYLLWALFLPTWYGNIPEESAFLLRRWHGAYRPLSVLVIVAVFFWGTAFNGILGMLFAIPLTAFFVTAWRLIRHKYLEDRPAA